LAVTGRAHSRDALAGLLWGESPEAKAKASLRTALSNLRRQLAPYVIITRQTVAFDRNSSYQLDIATFVQHIQAARLSRPAPERPRQRTEADVLTEDWVGALQAAVTSYRGDFLAGFYVSGAPAFEEWVMGQREWLRQLALQALHRLVAYHTTQGAYPAGIDAATRLLALEPWQEETHRQLMHLLALSGRRSEALAQYETCRRVLADELHVEPMVETTELYERIRDTAYVDVGVPKISPIGTPLQAPALPPSLPSQATPFIGREEELAQIGKLLRDPDYRLVALVGAGGVGKTRLALVAAGQVAGDFAQGVWFVPLAGVTREETAAGSDPSEPHGEAVAAIAETLGFTFSGQRAPLAQLLGHLRSREILLLLDGLEHLLDEGAEFIVDVLQNAPGVTILVTSRQRLNLQAAYAVRLEGLPVPAIDDAPSAASCSSVQLFSERADRTSGGFALNEHNLPHVAQVCRFVEGLPLGIELAAALVERLRPQEITRLIQQNLDHLATDLQDVPARHQSMRAVFESSYRLLSQTERGVLARASVFRGGFGREAATVVIGATPPDLQSLVDKSLLRREPPAQYGMHELVRRLAAEKLEALPDLQETAQERHSEYYLDFVAQREAALNGPQPQAASAEIQYEWENIEQAWHYAAIHTHIEPLARSLDGLSRFLLSRGLFYTGEVLFGTAAGAIKISGNPDDLAQRVLGRLLTGIARFLHERARYPQAATVAQAVIDLAQARQMIDLEAAGHLAWGRVLLSQGDYQAAQAQLEQALAQARTSGDPETEIEVHDELGRVALGQGAWDAAARHFEDELALARARDNWEGIGQATYGLGDVAWLRGEAEEAARYAEESLALYQRLGNRRGIASALTSLGLAAEMRDAYEEA
ncbi:MAG: tetratricopeptide repeat protein, partial [Chloroflexi bacterium]|nr:tetratricopeptide repeat protein [Chloroflexota bacterium]